MNKEETKFAGLVVDALESCGVKTLNVHGHRFQASGWPDLYVASRSWTGWTEFKVGSRRPSALQIIVMKDLLRNNVPAFVVRLKGGVVYCELWTRLGYGRGKARVVDEYETLAYCEDWVRDKGQTRGLSLLRMFDNAGSLAVKIILAGMIKNGDILGDGNVKL